MRWVRTSISDGAVHVFDVFVRSGNVGRSDGLIDGFDEVVLAGRSFDGWIVGHGSITNTF